MVEGCASTGDFLIMGSDIFEQCMRIYSKVWWVRDSTRKVNAAINCMQIVTQARTAAGK